MMTHFLSIWAERYESKYSFWEKLQDYTIKEYIQSSPSKLINKGCVRSLCNQAQQII